MKINYKNTCLEWLENPRKMCFHIPDNNKFSSQEEEQKFGESVRNGFIELMAKESDDIKPFRDKIRFISRPFLEAYEKARPSFANVFDKEEMEETGVFITQIGSFTNTYFYYLKTGNEGDDWLYDMNLMIFTKHSQAELPGLDCLVAINMDHEKGTVREKTFVYKEWEENGSDAVYWQSWLITLLLFIKYCPLETKFIAGGRKEHHVGQKYVNETKQKIEILDSTWFTTIVRSEGFGVRGHFRMQPYGPGMTQRRLQWIEPFEKEGYTRRAKIL